MDVPDAYDALPKVELHCHVEGAIRPQTVVELARKNGRQLPADDPTELYRYTSLDSFLEIFWLVQSLLADPDDWARAAYESIVDGAPHGLRYREMFFTPARHLVGGQSLAGIVGGLVRGIELAEAETGVRCMLICDIDRSFGPGPAGELVDAAVALRRASGGSADRLIGIGMDSTERGVDLREFADVFARARAAGFHVTAHAGEDTGPDNIAIALEALAIERIDHGVAIMDDPALAARVAELRIPLDVCPNSNVLIANRYEQLSEHPFRRMRQAGLLATLNTDDPAMTDLDLGRRIPFRGRRAGDGLGRDEDGGPGRRRSLVARCHRQAPPGRGVPGRDRRDFAPVSGAPDRVDLLIVDGILVDGTGAPPRAGTVGVQDGRLLLRDESWRPSAVRTIDAAGLVVSPGFIDLHSHGGLVVLADPRHEPKVRQGVTTEVIGVDGNGYAPFAHRDDLMAFVDLNAGLDGRPSLAYDWDSVASYLDRYDRGQAINVAVLVGNSALRIGAVGWDQAEATPAQAESMRAMLREAMEEGAFGVSSGLDYPPGSYASTGELAALTTAAAALGGFYHTHVRYPLGDRFLDPFREAIEIGRRGEGPVHITHFYHRQTHPGPPEHLLALVDDARAEGLDITFDTYPYEWASTRLLIQLPGWAHEGGPMALKERLADPGMRRRLRSELVARGAAYASAEGWADVRLGGFTNPANLHWESASVADVMRETETDAVDAICDLLLSENLGVAQVTTGPWTDGLRRFLAHPQAMIGTDSTFLGAKPSPRTYGSYPRILGQFVRDEALLSLEEAVRRMTGAPAARLGLRDRGLLRDGDAADLVAFDPARVRSNATHDDPRRFPDGIEHVIVNGTPVVDGGEHTGATPGRALRRGR